MGGIADAVTGNSAKKQRQLAAAAQAEQAERLATEEAKVAEIERGQRAIARRGGAGGLLAYVDDGLRSSFGA